MPIDLIFEDASHKSLIDAKNSCHWCETMFFNGRYINSSTAFIGVDSSILSGGIGATETIICKGNEPYKMILWRDHYFNICKIISILGFSQQQLPTADDFLRSMRILSQRNHYPAFSRVQITFWQQNDNPLKLSWAMHQERLDVDPMEVNTNTLKLCSFDDDLLAKSATVSVAMPSAIQTLAKRYATEQKFDEACLRNFEGKFVVSTMGNIFIVVGQTVVAVEREAGARCDAVGECLSRACRSAGFALQFTNGFTERMLSDESNEIFLAGAAFGIRIVDGFNDRRFMKNKVLRISQAFRDLFIF